MRALGAKLQPPPGVSVVSHRSALQAVTASSPEFPKVRGPNIETPNSKALIGRPPTKRTQINL